MILNNVFYIRKSTGVIGTRPSDLRIEAYDANRQRIGEGSGPVNPENWMRFISVDDIGSADHVYILVFYGSPNHTPPLSIGVITGTHGGSGNFSFAVEGTGLGFSGSGSVTVTEA